MDVPSEYGDEMFTKSEKLDIYETTTSEDEKLERINYCGLFRYARPFEICMFAIGILCSAALGALFPLSMALFADMVDELIRNFFSAAKLIEQQVPLFVYLAISSLVLGFIQMYFLTISSKRQIRRIRQHLFDSLVRQDASWMDSQASGSLISLLSSSLPQIQGGIGNRVGSFVRDTVLFLGCIIMAFVKGWKLALVASASLPLVGISFAILGFSLKYFNNKEIRAYGRAGGIAGEVLASIRTVFAYGGQDKTYERYSSELYKAEKTGIWKSMAIGAGNGFVSLSIFSAAALSLWYGVTLVRTERFSNGTVILVVVSIIISSIAIGKALPEVEAIARSVTAAKKVFDIINRVPSIKIDEDGYVPTDIKGKIEFKDVFFSYASRPDVAILKNFNLTILPGEKVAIVGFSGSGKSTAIHLVQRLYDPQSGEVLLDGQNIRELDICWLRSQLGTVSQEAQLFADTIAENIRMGNLDASGAEIEEAATLAAAHAFIMKMPEGYDTHLSEGGSKLSGGQRQRIAIARALVRYPKILLLDEATSALDTRSEKAVQMALDRACAGRTVIMVAHRLTTVRNADRIIVMKDGEIIEQGSHDELRELKGQYYRMLHAQGLLKEESVVQDSKLSIADLEKRGVKLFEEKLPEWDNTEKEDDEVQKSEVKESLTTIITNKYPMLHALRLNKPETHYLLLGLLMAIAVGIIEPLFALVYSDMFDLALMIFTPQKMQKKADELAVKMILLGVMRLIATFVQRTMLGIAGERLTKRVRGKLFKSIIKQEIAWFDKDENQPGILTARLAADAPSLEKISGSQLGVMIEATFLVIVSLAIACTFSWKLTLVNLAFFPFLILASVLQLKDVSASEQRKNFAGVRIAQEALNAHRTISSFSLEELYSQRFVEKYGHSSSLIDWPNIFFSTVSTIAQSMQYFQMAASFSVGAALLRQKEIKTFDVFRVFTLISFSAQGVGRAASFLPDLKSANTGARQIMELLERPTKMDVRTGDTPENSFSGNIEFKNVEFSYPDRKSVSVLQGFSHSVEATSSVALVGQSGCGKSTIIQLILRFYDVDNNDKSLDEGVFFDGINAKLLAPSWIRQHIGVVFQNSDLFDLSIRENIAFGDCSREVPMKEIIEAAEIANIHNFIVSLPMGYDTPVGIQGSQLSGGQRQRIAIARALVRKPALLLLDEATSALDAENERDVQAALSETISKASMTCVVVAHRLSTVSACNCVVVVDNGQKIECGPPDALLQARGAFYALHSASN